MDYILDGLRMMNYNAVSISQGIDTVHKKVIINLEKLDDNLDDL